MKPVSRLLLFVFTLTFSACSSTRNIEGKKDDGKIEIVFLQVNDVYEIAPIAGGKEGGMARVATVKKQWLQRNPNSFLVIAGDFVSPSVYNSIKFQDAAIRGKQMIEAMNAAGMDLAIFGNHEFDIKEQELQDRINESTFQWISSNSFHKTINGIVPFTKTSNGVTTVIPETFIQTIKDADGTTAKIGYIAITLPFNKADFVAYTEPLTTAKKLYVQLKDSVDAVVAITHQTIDEDKKLAHEIPGLAIIIGGHEHDMRFAKEGNVFITKAHANAKSAYVIQLKINKKKDKIKTVPKLVYLNESIPLDSATSVVVQKWVTIAEDNYSSLGFDAKKIVLQNSEPLDGREAEIRSHPTNLTKMIAAAMAKAAPQAQVVVFNAGSVRVDDVLQMPVSQYDIIRALPFGGGIREVEMKGSLLKKVLDQGQKNQGSGGYLVYNDAVNYDASNNSWTLNGNKLENDNIYRVGLTEFLLTGKEANLDYLNEQNPEIIKVYAAATTGVMADIRLALIRYLENK
jgi:2',3'-cyclic-nucleotide 2'-phosphodiesterase (5'-nucleotidase family)